MYFIKLLKIKRIKLPKKKVHETYQPPHKPQSKLTPEKAVL